MKNYGYCVGLLGTLALLAGPVLGQEPPLKKPATPSGPTVPATLPPLPAANPPLTFVGQPIPGVYRNGIAVGGPCAGQCPQPIFRSSTSILQDIDYSNGVADRAMNLGNIGINFKRLADVLERGFPNIAAPGIPGVQANQKIADEQFVLADEQIDQPKVGGDKIRPAGGDLQGAEYKQMLDAMNGIFKTQADLIRSMDIGAVNRPRLGYNYNYRNGFGNPACPNGDCGPDGCTAVLTGRTGLKLSMLAPQTHDILNLPRLQGLYVKEVFPNTPAEAAGFRSNDVLIEFDGRKVPSNFIGFLNGVFNYVKNDTPINSVVLRAGLRVEVNGMKITDRRVVPALPDECPLDALLPSIIQVVPGINSNLPNTNVMRELRTVARPGGITEFIWVDVPRK